VFAVELELALFECVLGLTLMGCFDALSICCAEGENKQKAGCVLGRALRWE
jgi:hypothetical protein